jgi:hydroxypyruvate isomerase
MLRFSANISTMYQEIPFLQRFGAAAGHGFKAVEIQYAYAFPVEEVVAARQKAGVECVLINSPAGDHAKGDRGIASLPDRMEEMKAGLETAKRYAAALGAKRMHLVAGRHDPGADLKAARETFLENIRRAARLMADIGLTVCLEPINTWDIPGFFLSRPAEALSLIDECGEKNVALQFDFYHMQRMQGELIPSFERLLPRIAHVQFADTPGRHEPGTGEINHASIFACIERSAYTGWTGAEYTPSRPTGETLDWFAPYRGH